MAASLLLTIAAIVLFLIHLYCSAYSRPPNFPPGPPRLPLWGSYWILLLNNYTFTHVAIRKLARKYKTKVLGFFLGPFPTVVATDYDSVHEMLTRPEYLGRPDTIVSQSRALGKRFAKWFMTRSLKSGVERIFSIEHMLKADDYTQYGIKIKVKYRDAEELQDLNRFLQSGGERSVATAIYMIALQELTHVPFRCVDEINQGMDPVNERRVFSLLVNATSRSGTAQYFLLTPKLLPSLTYTQQMQIVCINNGTSYTDFNMKKIIRTVRSRKHSSSY